MKTLLLLSLFWPHPSRWHVDWKLWLAVGGLGASFTADYVTTMRCQPGCSENNGQFGPHPSGARVAAIGGAYFAGEAALAIWMRHSKRPWLRKTWWILPAADAAYHARLAQQNAAIK